MTTHVFIVDINTFKYHLEYMFAGTGARDCTIDFNNNENTNMHYATENNLVSLIADIKRIASIEFPLVKLLSNSTIYLFAKVEVALHQLPPFPSAKSL